ncbi:MAG: hypothetical protein JOZ68_09835 [Acidimicrobiia bacterium]|nr:hypothetical protein [Acidimicrobiia bacterium]
MSACVIAVVLTTPGSADGGGVPPGSDVVVRTNPTNGVVYAVRQGAVHVGLGAVLATGFRADCSAIVSKVVVCRDRFLHQGHTATNTVLGADSCVVHADPRLGGSNPGVDAMTRALRQCIAPGQLTTTTTTTLGVTTTAVTSTSTTAKAATQTLQH